MEVLGTIMLKLLKGAKTQRRNELLGKYYRDLIHREAKIGGEIFGPISNDVRREFFCLDEHTWVWHEEWTDEKGYRQIITTRYTIRPNGILKAQNNSHYQKVSNEEAVHLIQAVRIYLKRVKNDIYQTA